MSKMAEFVAMRDLFARWATTGVPDGIDYPKTQSAAVGWRCPKFGIASGIGSKAYFRATHPEFGAIVSEISELIRELTPASLIADKSLQSAASTGLVKRVYKTQKARRHAAEARATEAETMLRANLTILQETRHALVVAKNELKVEEQRVEASRRDVVRLEKEVADLKRLIAATGLGLRAVE